MSTNDTAIEFLLHVLYKDITQNVFSDKDGFARGKQDGKALHAVELLNLIERLRL